MVIIIIIDKNKMRCIKWKHILNLNNDKLTVLILRKIRRKNISLHFLLPRVIYGHNDEQFIISDLNAG